MRGEEIRSLKDQGHMVGGHTHRHVALSRMTADECREDVIQNIETLREIQGGTVSEWFSFPFGDESAEGMSDLCKEIGIRYAFLINGA